MLYHAILQLNQKAKQSKKTAKLLKKHMGNQGTRQTKKAQSQSQHAFNNQNTIDRRNDFKKLATPK